MASQFSGDCVSNTNACLNDKGFLINSTNQKSSIGSSDDSDSRNLFFTHTNKGLHIASLNIQHLLPKFDEIHNHLSCPSTTDIFGLCETFLNNDVLDSVIKICNYTLERKDREHKKGGGVLVYIHERIPYTRRFDLEHPDIESICIEIKYNTTKPLILNFVYRPPDAKLSWISLFESIIETMDCSNADMLHIGDFNIQYYPDNTKKQFSNASWSNMVLEYGLSQLITKPTRISDKCQSIIDHIYTNRTDIVNGISVPDYCISDHQPICCTLSLNGVKLKHNKHKSIIYRSFKNFNLASFQSDLSISPISSIETCYDPNDSLHCLYNIINDTLSKHAPFKEKRIKKEVQPEWFDNEVKTAIYTRNILKQNRQFTEFKIQRNKIYAMIRKKKRDFYNQAIKQNKSPSFLWKTLKSVAKDDKSTGTSNIPQSLTYRCECIQGDDNILNAFNDHFVNISNIVQRKKFNPNNFSKLENYLNDRIRNDVFTIKPITVSEVKQIIVQLNSNKSTGLDGIGANILKYCSDYIIQPITFIINQSIDQGVFPDSLKAAYISPIYKGGDKCNPNNYRPISILSTITKIFECHIAKQLQTYFKKTNIIHETQSGFRQNHSCQTALINLVNSWLKDIDNGKMIGVVFLDLQKAFDLVDHDILLHKLKLYHFSPKTLSLFASYLSDRLQLVKNGLKTSDMLQVRSGVPQGSVLGPLLFILYINDISMVTKDCNLDLYADDSTLYYSDNDLSKIQTTLQNNICALISWCNDNNMCLNPSKTKCMLISTPHKHKQLLKGKTTFNLYIDKTLIDTVTEQKVLGVHIENTLSWKSHLAKITSKINTGTALLKRISYYLTTEMQTLFYNAYILPVMDYCSIVWGHDNSCKKRMLRLQTRIAKIITKSKCKESTLIFDQLKWLTFIDRYKIQIGSLVYKVSNGSAPQYICNMLTFSSNDTYQLRSVQYHDLITLRPKTNYLRTSFPYLSTSIWNNIPTSIRFSPSLNTFKKNYKLLLLKSH